MNKRYCHLVVLPQADGRVYGSWRLPADVPTDMEFKLYRAGPDNEWKDVSGCCSTGTCFIDTPPQRGTNTYRIAPQREDWISETRTVDTLQQTPTNIWFRASLPVAADACRHCVAADIDNDGRMDFVVRYCEGSTVKLAGIRGDGKHVWTLDTALPACGAWDGSAHHVPFFCWDIDNDGRMELVFHSGGSGWTGVTDSYYDCAGNSGELCVIADAETGEIKRSCRWPAHSARVMMTVGYLKGFDTSPQIVILDDRYGSEVITAIDGIDASVCWTRHQHRLAGHNLDIADINNDGIQEVIAGGTCYEGNGDILWNAETFGHTDMSKPANIDPQRPGLEVWYLVENNRPGVYLVDSQGNTIFHEPFRHAHFGWIARHTTEFPGLQLHAAEDRRDRGNTVHHPVFLPDGTHWAELSNEHSRDLMPVQWDGGEETVFIHRRNNHIVRYNPNNTLEPLAGGVLPPNGVYQRNIICADIIGDYREDIVTFDSHSNELIGITNTTMNERRKLSPMESFAYRHDRSQHGSGYYLYVAPYE